MNLPRPFGPYSLLRRLAVGGMAEIYVAKTRGLGGFEKLVAIKLVHPHLSADSHFVQMLIDEAKILVLLTHANIAQVFDLGCIDGTYYIAMEFVEGMDVHGLQKSSANVGEHLPVSVCCYITSEVLNGLDYAHRRRDGSGKSLNLVHRDVSPQNVLISQAGEVKLVDFGIAKTTLRGEGTEVGVIKGKYYYMSPEQAWADPMDRRSDIFSTGIVLHEMLTGRMLYSAQSIPELISKVREAEITPPDLIRAEVPGPLSKIVMRALAREPKDRYQSALDMGEALRDFLYDFAPAFNAGRLAQYVADLVDAEAKVVRNRPSADATGGLPRLTRDEFVRNENSVLFRLPDGVLATRNETLPSKLRRSPSVAPTPVAPAPSRRLVMPRISVPGDRAPPPTPVPSFGPFGDSAPPTEIMHPPDSRRVSGWPFADAQAPELGADEPTKLWNGSDLQTHLSDETLIDSGLSAQYARQVARGAFDAAALPMPNDGDPTDRYQSDHAIALAKNLPPASDWPTPEVMRRVSVPGYRPLAPTSQAGTPALVPPPGTMPSLGTIPPSPLVPDFSAQPPLFKRRSRAPLPWLQIGIGVLFALLGVITFQLTRPRQVEPTLEIVSVPAGALVEVNGTRQPGVTPIKLTALESGRSYELGVSLPGYLPWAATYRAAPGPVQHIAVLKPITAVLHVLSQPTGAQIWMDDVAIGRAPLSVSSLPVGRKVRLRALSVTQAELRKDIVIRGGDLRPTLTFDFSVTQ